MYDECSIADVYSYQIRCGALKKRELEKEISSLKRRLQATEQKCSDISGALEEQQSRETQRAKEAAESRRVVDQQYTYLIEEYEERIQGMEGYKQEKEDEVRCVCRFRKFD